MNYCPIAAKIGYNFKCFHICIKPKTLKFLQDGKQVKETPPPFPGDFRCGTPTNLREPKLLETISHSY